MGARAGAAAASAPAAPPPPAVCGKTSNCAESNDFAAMITNLRELVSQVQRPHPLKYSEGV